jgi:hypothetical protein
MALNAAVVPLWKRWAIRLNLSAGQGFAAPPIPAPSLCVAINDNTRCGHLAYDPTSRPPSVSRTV